MAALPRPNQRPPLVKRVPPGAWPALVWGLATAYPLVDRLGRPGPVFAGAGAAKGFGLLLVVAAGLVGLSTAVVRRPMSAMVMLLTGTVVSTTALSVLGIPLLEFLPVDIGVCYLAATHPRRTSVPAAALALATVTGYTLARALLHHSIQGPTALIVALSGLVAWLIGDSVHQNRVHAEAAGTQAAEQAVAAERLRIARELHDMIAHSVGVIAIQAGMGSRVIDTQPEEARAALSTIELTSRETLASLRRTLTALRRTAPGGPDLAPAPGLADLDRLTASTAAAGVRVALRREGAEVPLPPDVDLAAYRIVQESLTNVVRYAAARACTVTITYGERELRVRIEDGPAAGGRREEREHGHRPAARGPGFGIAGMRERVALLDGRFAAGPLPAGGFRVETWLPLPADETVAEAPASDEAVAEAASGGSSPKPGTGRLEAGTEPQGPAS
ncbi:sensor histidine kinase [Streptomyces sp. NPDC020917]|uniref:sensor histidine kinase n=1 Tax=Streptomyces sp. NPDC020917 TaxID=3365102 RepID=UPI003794C905